MRISYSRFSTYQVCPQQYKLQYVDGIEVPTPPAMLFGAAVHEALKFMYDPQHLRRPALEQVMEAFAQAWRAREAEVGEEERQAYFEQGVDMLRRHYQRHGKQEEGRYTAATERFFNVPFNREHTLVGYVDRVDVLSASGGLEIIDYKTTRTMSPEREMAKSAQLAIYRMAADHLYPGREVTTTLWYLLHDYQMHLAQTQGFLEEKREEIREVIGRIEAGEFAPNPGSHCDRCAYRPHCPLFREPVVPKDLEVDIGKLLRQYVELEAEEKEAGARRAELRQAIEEYLDRCHTERVEGGGYAAERRQWKRVSSWDVGRLREVLGPLGLWEKVTEVSSGAVRRLLASEGLSWEEKRSIEAAAEYTESRVLRVRPVSGGDGEELEEGEG